MTRVNQRLKLKHSLYEFCTRKQKSVRVRLCCFDDHSLCSLTEVKLPRGVRICGEATSEDAEDHERSGGRH